MNKFFTSLVLFCTFLLIRAPQQAQAAFIDPKLEIRTLMTDHFYIHYPREVAPVAKDLAGIAEHVHTKLSEKLKWKPWGRTHVLLVDKTDSANGLATVIPANYLLLYVTPPDADSSLDHYKNYLELLFTHEYTHILHIDQHYRVADPFHWLFGKIVAPNGLTPGWMREGIAAWEESVETGRGRAYGSYNEMILRTNILENSFPAIDEIAGLGFKWPGSNSQYIYGVKFFQWLAQKYGEDKIQRYAEEYASGLWLFSLNNKARRVFGKSFYKLWKEWQEDLKAQYLPLKENLSRQGLTSLEKVVTSKNNLGYLTLNPQGTGYAYSDASNDESSKIYIVTNSQSKPQTLKRFNNGQMSFSRDGGLLAFSSAASVEKYNIYNEVYVYDLTKKTLVRLSEKGKEKASLRAMDPDFSPLDGGRRWVVMVRTELGTDNLYVFDKDKRKGYYLTDAPRYTQFSNPRFSPDGQFIVVSRRDHNGNRDLVLYSNTGNEIRKLTQDEANDNHPIWSGNRSVYYTSDKEGIPNIYRTAISGGATQRITNVLTGVSSPQLSNDGRDLYVSYYTSRGFELRKTSHESGYRSEAPSSTDSLVSLNAVPDSAVPDSKALFTVTETNSRVIPSTPSGLFDNALNPIPAESSKNKSTEIKDRDVAKQTTKEAPETVYEKSLQGKPSPTFIDTDIEGSTKYSAFPQLLVPRYLVPTFATLDDSFLIGFATGRFDPLYRHNWGASVSYRTDVNFTGGDFVYSYTRYNPTFFVGASRYALNWGNLFVADENFFEERLRGFAGVSFPLGHHGLSLSYFFENRDNLTTIPAGFSLPQLDRYAGLHFSYIYSRYSQFNNSISQENGPFFKLDLDVTNSIFGSAEVNEQEVLSGDFRYYFELPWGDHHVFGLRTAAGYAFGDREFSGSFRFGGPFGEGNLAGYSSRLFPFRGLPGVNYAGDRALLFSAEYRLPIATIERGIGTWPIFLRQIHMSFFTDYGDIWARNGKDNVGFFDDFMLSVGAEVRGNFVIGYGLPVTARLGYGIVVVNRDRVAFFEDSTFGLNATNGNFYLQFGTSF